MKNAKPPRLSSKPGPEIKTLGGISQGSQRADESQKPNGSNAACQSKRRSDSEDLGREASLIFAVALRQKILAVPDTLSRKLVNVADPAQARRILRQSMLNLLNELQDLPSKVVDPDWLEVVEGNGDGDQQFIRQSSGQQIKAEAEKAKRRRKQKTETMRKLRAECY